MPYPAFTLTWFELFAPKVASEKMPSSGSAKFAAVAVSIAVPPQLPPSNSDTLVSELRGAEDRRVRLVPRRGRIRAADLGALDLDCADVGAVAAAGVVDVAAHRAVEAALVGRTARARS